MLKEFRFQSQGAKVNCILPIHFDKMQTFLSNLGWTRSGSFHSKSYSCLTFGRFGMSLSAITSFEFNLRGGQYSESSRAKMFLLLLKPLFISVVRVVEMGYLLSVNIVWKCHPLILSMFSTKQTVQDEKYLLFVNIENGRPSPPLNSYVYISYQAKHPFNFSNIKEDKISIKVQISLISKIYLTWPDIVIAQNISCASTLLRYLPQASDRGTCIWRAVTLVFALVIALALVLAVVQVPVPAYNYPF